jgi:glycosyltransferase involved in cell wall biosynthesis
VAYLLLVSVSTLGVGLTSLKSYYIRTFMDKIRLHILAIPYTITRSEYSHDAYTGKVLRFSPMMISRGFEVYHYGVETSESGATKQIDIMTKDEWNELRIKTWQFVDKSLSYEDAVKKNNDHSQVISQLSNWSSPLTKEFNIRARKHLIENHRGNKTDIVCFPLSRTHNDAVDKLGYLTIETGIGYADCYLNFRVFESYAWLSHTLGREKKDPNNYWFVIPNYFDTAEFKLSLTPKPKRIGFLGRISDTKGCRTIMEIARRFPDVEFILCGQGNPKTYLEVPNIKYKEPIHGEERSEYLGSCMAVLCLSKYLEPFCGVAVEAQLCGTPVISTDYGAMVETVENGKTGLRGHTLADYCHGVQMALDNKFDRQYIRDRAVSLYDMYNVAYQYEYVFNSVLDIQNGNNGWYSKESHLPALNRY